MERYLSTLLRAGARPIGRGGGPARRAPVIPVLNVEHLAAAPEASTPLEPFASPASQTEAVPTTKPEPGAVEPETRVTIQQPGPAEAELPVVPSAVWAPAHPEKSPGKL